MLTKHILLTYIVEFLNVRTISDKIWNGDFKLRLTDKTEVFSVPEDHFVFLHLHR